MVPRGWKKHKIGTFLKLLQERVPATTDYPVLTSSRQGLYRQDEYFADRNLLNDGEYGVLPRGYITYRHMSDDLIFKFNINNLCDYGAISKEYPVFTTTEELDSYFLLMSLNHGHQFQQFAIEQKQGGTRTRLYFSKLQQLKLSLPPIEEQQQIAKILSTWDKAIATTEKLIATSQQQKKALMQQLLTGKKRLVNPDTGKVFEGDWVHVSLSKLVKVTGGNAFKSEQFQAMGIPLIKISNIKPNYSVTIDSSVFISEDIKYQKFKVIKGDILIAMSGATTGKVGCYQFDEFSYLNQRVGRFDPKKGKIIKSYLFQLLKLPKVQHDILIDAVGGAQPNISNKDIERLKVIVPTANEQQKIASVLTAADKEIELLQAKLAHLKDEKKALMQQLLTGKRRVKVEEQLEIVS